MSHKELTSCELLSTPAVDALFCWCLPACCTLSICILTISILVLASSNICCASTRSFLSRVWAYMESMFSAPCFTCQQSRRHDNHQRINTQLLFNENWLKITLQIFRKNIWEQLSNIPFHQFDSMLATCSHTEITWPFSTGKERLLKPPQYHCQLSTDPMYYINI